MSFKNGGANEGKAIVSLSNYQLHLDNYFRLHVCLSFRLLVRSCVTLYDFQFLPLYHKMWLTKFTWYVLKVKNMHSGSSSDPWVYYARQSWATYMKTLGKESKAFFSVSPPPQCWFKAVVCINTPRMYLQRGYFLVIWKTITTIDVVLPLSCWNYIFL